MLFFLWPWREGELPFSLWQRKSTLPFFRVAALRTAQSILTKIIDRQLVTCYRRLDKCQKLNRRGCRGQAAMGSQGASPLNISSTKRETNIFLSSFFIFPLTDIMAGNIFSLSKLCIGVYSWHMVMGSLETFHLSVSCTWTIFTPLSSSLSLCTPSLVCSTSRSSHFYFQVIYRYIDILSYVYIYILEFISDKNMM